MENRRQAGPEFMSVTPSQTVSGLPRSKLSYLVLSVDSVELLRVVETRNRVVHDAGQLPTGTYGSHWRQYRTAVSLVTTVFLAILKYDGFISDWAKHTGNG
jgi:hypothetical protein